MRTGVKPVWTERSWFRPRTTAATPTSCLSRWPLIRGILGVVGWIDLMTGAGAEAAAAELKSSGRVVGIRHLIHDEPDPTGIVQPAVIDGLRTLAAVGAVVRRVSVLPSISPTLRRSHRRCQT